MAKRKRVGEMDTTTVVLIGLGVLGAVFLLMQGNKPATPTVVTTLPAGQTTATAVDNYAAAAATLAPTVESLFSGDTEES
jgi:hypothetical protein